MADNADLTQKTEETATKAATPEPSSSTEKESNAAESSKSASTSSSSPEESAEPASTSESSPTPPQPAWQAIYSPQHNAYYFYNAETQETTWTNPLEPAASAPQEASDGPSTAPSASTSSYKAREAAALAAGIDPSLAYLDPSLAYAGIPGASTAPNGQPLFTAKFNARTGAFTANNARDPTHLSEYERAKRMSEFYFDVNQWEQDLATRQEEDKDEAGKKRKRPTKKDLVCRFCQLKEEQILRVSQERFKEQKRLKKIAKTAWLRPAHLKHLRLLHHHDSSFDRHDEHHSALQEKEDEERRRLAQLGATDDLGVGDEDESNELLSLDPKEWKKHDYYAVLGLSKLRFTASQDQIKIAHRKKVLKHHPDKKAAPTDSSTTSLLYGTVNTNDDAFFKCISKAYEVLSHAEKRRQFDSVDPEFQDRWDDAPTAADLKAKMSKAKDPNQAFFKEMAPFFELYSRFSRKQPVPQLGSLDASKEEVEGFYDFWYNIDSWRSFEWLDKEINEGSDNRDDKRYTEKKNKTERARRKKEDTAKVRGLVDLALSVDPRIKRIKQEEKAAREAKKAASRSGTPGVNGKVNGKPSKEEEERKKKEEEEKKAAEELAKAEAKKAKAAAANAAKKARRAARAAEDGATLSKEEFDFIVVGGGPSGCALATRLYERTEGKASVLLVEAGMHPEESPELNNCVPQILQTRALHGSAFDYAYPTHHEDDISNGGRRELVLNSGRHAIPSRCKVLGGSTCINFGIWTKGAMADYDLWASLVGSDEFSWAKMGPFFDRVASLAIAPSKGPIRTRLISQSPRVHYWSSIARRGLEESGFVPLDINGGLREVDGSGPGGIGSGQAREDEGEGKRQAAKDVFGEMTECIGGSDSRQQVRSTALRYFEDVVDPLYSQQAVGGDGEKKGKFEVWTSLRVESVVFEEKKAVGVKTRFGIFPNSPYTAPFRVSSNPFYVSCLLQILCGGAIQSPYILLSSGVGPASHLAARGIPLVHDSPGVGRNLWEHPFVDVQAKLRPAHRKDTVETFASLMTSAPHLHQWATQRTGLMSGLLYEWLAYSNMHSELSPFFSPSSSSPALFTPTATDTHVLLRANVPHIEHFIHYGHGLAPAPDPIASSYVAVTTVLLVPRSRGYVEIPPSADSNPIAPDGKNEKPHIVVNQLKDPIDRYALRNAVRRAYAILGAPAWRESLEDVGEKGDAELDEIIERGVATLWHYGGTCAMKTSGPAAGGSATLADGVVDTQFRVEGVEGLRVADTSVIPFPVSGHTQAVAYAIGEKMAELLAREYNF
ncbi:hypothetical protein EYR40_000181 [Pleurotus pulmonarius]|nr:hypothetical protein EYR40_000181 [Pleurotus pulmonarius]